MGSGRLAGSWRHASETFGVDYARHAVVRRFNLGRTRFDSRADHRFAGDDVRVNSFHSCVTCGGTTSDGPPVVAATLGVTSSVGRPRGADHHRPWCPGWRGSTMDHRALVLAHELGTEALRILVPAVAALVEERILSFQAALHLGIAARYGGDPDHLRTVRAYMPDNREGGTGEQRQFVVLFDIQPGGTGYLHRLADPEEFRLVLTAARDVIANCVCAGEGRPACHRCLLRYARENEFSLMSKQEALDLLDRLLARWQIQQVSSTDEISLIRQVESELEATFLQALLDWGARSDTPASITKSTDRDGARVAELRFTSPSGAVTHWRMKLQNTIEGTRPDVYFSRLDAAGPPVAVYLDGYKYHASEQYNRLADDATKRGILRAHPMYVFAVTWDDVQRWSGRNVASEPAWLPYQENGKRAARQVFTQLGGRDADELNTFVWTNPIDTLLAYLTDPDAEVWRRRSVGALAGLLTQPGAKTTASSGTVGAAITAALRGTALPAPSAGRITVVRTADGNGCPLTLIADARQDATPVWSALATVDDRTSAVRDDDPDHRRRWAAWLYWGNLIQFLDSGGGDGDQLAVSTLDTFEPAQLAVCEGTGLVLARRVSALDEETATWLGLATVPEAEPEREAIDEAKADQRWRDVLRLLFPGESGLESLVRGLITRGVPPPEQGYELGDAGWQAELAWPDRRIAVVVSGDIGNHEIADRNRAYAAHGWEARTARQWNIDDLIEKLMATSGNSREGH